MAKSKQTKRTNRTDAQRLDDWTNLNTRIGSELDKRKAATFRVEPVTTRRDVQEEMWRGDGTFARIVELLPDTAMRAGWGLKIEQDAPDTATEGLPGDDAEPDEYDGEGEDGDKPEDVDPAVDKPTEGDETKPPYKADAFPPGGGGGGPAALLPQAPKAPPPPIKLKDDGHETAEAVLARAEELRTYEKLNLAWKYSRAYGGGAVLIGADDGNSDLSVPLDLERIKTVRFLNVLTRREIIADTYYSDPSQPKYGEPETFRIAPDITFMSSRDARGEKTEREWSAGKVVHESRLLLFPGIVVSPLHRVRTDGWGDSILVRIYHVIQDFETSYASAAHLVQDFAQAVFKIKGLAQTIMQEREDVIVARAQLVEQNRSVARAILVDAEGEEFERKQTPVTGLKELLEAFGLRVAAEADTPYSLLMGQAPTGLNATGETELRWFYDRAADRRERQFKPQLEYLLRILMLAKDGPTKGIEPENWCIEFKPLWQETDEQKANVREVMSRADVAYVNAGIVTPGEVAASRFGGVKYSLDTVIDTEDREKQAADFEVKQAQHEEERKKAADDMAKKGIAPAGAPPFGKPGAKPPAGKKPPPFGKK